MKKKKKLKPNIIRVFEDANGNQLRVLEAHHRHIFVTRKRTVCIPFPRMLCWSRYRVNKVQYDRLLACAFIEDDAKINLSTRLFMPPFPHMNAWTPGCHPYAEWGRDLFEKDFNGFFASPFSTSDYFDPRGKMLFDALGSFRAWSELTHMEVLKRFKEAQKRSVGRTKRSAHDRRYDIPEQWQLRGWPQEILRTGSFARFYEKKPIVGAEVEVA